MKYRIQSYMLTVARLSAVILAMLVCSAWAKGSDTDTGLFPTDQSSAQWNLFDAAGFSKPVCGVIHRREHPAKNGVSLGAIDTGCIDLETSGLWGYCTIFNTHVPRRGPMNLPFLGLSVGGQTWVLCDPNQIKTGEGNFQIDQGATNKVHWDYLKRNGEPPLKEPNVQNLDLRNVKTPKEIHYWGHYPVADLEYDIDGPVQIGMRAWSPFLPGDVKSSMIPVAVFEVHLRNAGQSSQQGTVAFSFPGPTALEAGAEQFARETVQGEISGVEVSAQKASYFLGVIGEKQVHLGGEMGADGAAWAGIADVLPDTNKGQSGSSVAVRFELKPASKKVVRFLLTWSSPNWNAGGRPWANKGNNFQHMYVRHYPNALKTARLLAGDHETLLKRVLAWQQVIYTEDKLPIWLRDSLINILHLITEDGMWAQAAPPIPDWIRPEDGLFAMNECPRDCPQMECIPCSFYGNIPIVYFFPELALSTLRGYKGYHYPDGAAVWVWGGFTAEAPPIEFVRPTKGYQFTTNGISLAAMVDRYLQCYGKSNQDFLREFFPMVKSNMIYTVNLRTTPSYAIGERIIAMPDGDVGTEWVESDKPGWFGMVSHAGGLHLAQLRIAERMASLAGDEEFAQQCREWIRSGMQSMEDRMWNGACYLNCLDPETGKKSDLIFSNQLDGQWVASFHGLPGVFRPDRIKTTLDTVKRYNVALSKTGAVFYTNSAGSLVQNLGGYGPYCYFPSEALMLSMTYLYNGQREIGLELAQKVWHNLVCRQGYTWNQPCVMRGDADTGERFNGQDYYQNMMLWSLPAAIENTDLSGPRRPGGLVDRVIRAGQLPVAEAETATPRETDWYGPIRDAMAAVSADPTHNDDPLD